MPGLSQPVGLSLVTHAQDSLKTHKLDSSGELETGLNKATLLLQSEPFSKFGRGTVGPSPPARG